MDMPLDEKVRVTLLMPKSVDREIEIFAAETGQPKNVVVTAAISAGLELQRQAFSRPQARPNQTRRRAAA